MLDWYIKKNKKSVRKLLKWWYSHQAVLKHYLRKQKKGNLYITSIPPGDGVGAQAHARLSTMLMAESLGLTYLHTPFRKISHNELNDNDWVEKWEGFLNIGAGKLSTHDIAESLKEFTISHPSDFSYTYSENTLFVIRDCHFMANRHPNRYERFKTQLENNYAMTAKDGYDNGYETGKTNIAIHIRRGDVSKTDEPHRFTDNSRYVKLLDLVVTAIRNRGQEFSIHLFSEGAKDDFGDFSHLPISYHLNENTFKTFHGLVSADILIMSKSSFSYVAALLSKGVVIYEPFWSKPLKRWVVAKDRDLNSTLGIHALKWRFARKIKLAHTSKPQ